MQSVLGFLWRANSYSRLFTKRKNEELSVLTVSGIHKHFLKIEWWSSLSCYLSLASFSLEGLHMWADTPPCNVRNLSGSQVQSDSLSWLNLVLCLDHTDWICECWTDSTSVWHVCKQFHFYTPLRSNSNLTDCLLMDAVVCKSYPRETMCNMWWCVLLFAASKTVNGRRRTLLWWTTS